MEADAAIRLQELRVDGGAVVNNFLMQFQADLLGCPVVRPRIAETTALGAAYLAGLAVGVFKNKAEIAAHWSVDRRFDPTADGQPLQESYRCWHKAVARAQEWEDVDATK
jgi:glycerol kinase